VTHSDLMMRTLTSQSETGLTRRWEAPEIV
jgi:hypothetical protein